MSSTCGRMLTSLLDDEKGVCDGIHGRTRDRGTEKEGEREREREREEENVSREFTVQRRCRFGCTCDDTIHGIPIVRERDQLQWP